MGQLLILSHSPKPVLRKDGESQTPSGLEEANQEGEMLVLGKKHGNIFYIHLDIPTMSGPQYLQEELPRLATFQEDYCAKLKMRGAGQQVGRCPWLSRVDPTPHLGRDEVRNKSLSSFQHLATALWDPK